MARGEYVARMDADDVSMPERFAIQRDYLDCHRDIGVCGSWIETFGTESSEVVQYPGDDGTIRCQLLFSSSLAHPATMFRRNLILNHHLFYDEQAVHAEDYDLWVRASQHTRFANVPTILLRYRIHPRQIGRRYELETEESSRSIRLSQLARLGLNPAPDEALLHHHLSRWQFEPSTTFLSATRAWFDKLMNANRLRKVYPEDELVMVLGRRWSEVCSSATHKGVRTMLEFWRTPHLASAAWSPIQHLKFVVKCLIRKDIPTRKA